MKKFTMLISPIIFAVLFTSPVYAVSPTSSAKPTSESVTEKFSDQINNLKEKIASRVAQLKLVEKRGIIGTVKEVNGTQFTLTDLSANSRVVDVDEITKFSSSASNESFGLSDLKPGSKISVIGLYNKDSERLLARFIDSITLPLFLSGAISNIDKPNFTITVAMEEGKSYLVDIENVTKTMSYTDTAPERSGFSKLETGNRIKVIGYPDKKEKNRMVATRILVFPSLPKNPKVVIAPNAVKDESVTSTGSGKKLTPLTQPR